MKRNYSIILSVIVIIILLAVLVFLLFTRNSNDSTQNEDVFSNLENDNIPGLEGGEIVPEDNPDRSTTTPESAYIPLRQLTTRNTIGFGEVDLGSTSPLTVYIAESGVGHVFALNLEDGTETRVSATTIPDARFAAFSPTGELMVVLTGDSDAIGTLQFGTIEAGRVTNLTTITSGVSAVKLYGETLLYTIHTNLATQVRTYDLERGTDELLYSIPFRESVVRLGDTLEGVHIAYPKTSHLLEGFVLTYESGTLTRLPYDGFGLVANGSEAGTIVTKRDGSTLQSTVVSGNTQLKLPHPVMPEKCLTISAQDVICAKTQEITLPYQAIDEWYSGERVFNDNWHWYDITDTIVSNEFVSIEAESGRFVDVIAPALGALSNDLYFKNKIDNTLWWFDLSPFLTPETTI